MTLLRVDEIGEFQRITHEENRRVVADQIPITLGRIEFHREAAHVALGIGRAQLAGHGREAQDHRRLRARLQRLRLGILGDVAGDGQRAIGTPALGMDDTFGDAFAILVCQLFEQLIILEQQRTARACAQAVLVIGNRRTRACRHHWLIDHIVLLSFG